MTIAAELYSSHTVWEDWFRLIILQKGVRRGIELSNIFHLVLRISVPNKSRI